MDSFRTRETYGLFRFGAFLALILLLVGSLTHWFRDPFSPSQIISWILLLTALSAALHGAYLLIVVGKARHRLVEDTQELVERGIYRYIRHPMYAALLFGGWGLFLKRPDPTGGLLARAVTVFLSFTARFEEKHNLTRYGDPYAHYIHRTRMFIPHIL